MADTWTLQIHTAQAYDAVIGPGLLAQAGARIREQLPRTRRIAVITDDIVAPLYLPQTEEALRAAGFSVCRHILPAGEQSKTLENATALLNVLSTEELTRWDCVAALGGGMVGDLAGFAAGCYLRGIPLVQLPTSLLAMVDSSVGGKTGVNLPAGKNLAGLFIQPSLVLCDIHCLRTLPENVRADGMAEAVKTAVTGDEGLFHRLEAGLLFPQEVIARCIARKAALVEEDERDTGPRQLLNLGHTVGHAVEVCSHYAVSHGHAVASGLAVIARASERLGWAETGTAARICACLEKYGLPVSCDFSAGVLTQAIRADKKRSGEEITLVIPLRVGVCQRRQVRLDALEDIIWQGLEA